MRLPRLLVPCLLLLTVSVLSLAATLVSCGDWERPNEPETTTSTEAPEVRAADEAARLVGRPSGSGSSVTVEPPPVAPSLDPSGPPSFGRREKHVRVVDMQGRPVAGANVRPLGWGREDGHTTDADGRAPTGRLGGGHGTPSQFRRSWTVVIEAQGYAPHAHYCRANDDSEEVVTLRTRGYVLSGRCRTTDGRGVRPTHLFLRGGEMEYPLEADETGRFGTASAPPSRRTLVARAEGWIAAPVEIVAPDESVEVVFFRPSRICGTLEAGPKRRRAALQRLRLAPDAYDFEVDEDSGRFEAVTFPGTVRLWSRNEHLGTFEIEQAEVLELGPIQLAEKAAARGPRPAARPTSFVDLDFGGRERWELKVVGAFEDLGLVDLGYARLSDARVELPSDKVLWLGFGPSFSSTCWRQEAVVGQRLRIQVPALVPVRMGALSADHEHVAGGGRVLRWAGSRFVATSLGRSNMDEDGPAVGPGLYDLVWYPSYHAECVVLRRGISVARGDELLDLGDVVVPRAVALRVRVEDERGAALTGVVVTLERGHDSQALRTDAGGEIEFTLRDPTAITLVVDVPGIGKTTRYLATADEDQLVILRLAR